MRALHTLRLLPLTALLAVTPAASACVPMGEEAAPGRGEAPGPDLSGRDLKLAVLRGMDLRRASFRNADLTGADLRGAALAGADFTGACLFAASLPPDLGQTGGVRLSDTLAPDGTLLAPSGRVPREETDLLVESLLGEGFQPGEALEVPWAQGGAGAGFWLFSHLF